MPDKLNGSPALGDPADSLDADPRGVLELNGYNAIRTQAFNALEGLSTIPAVAWDAALAYNDACRDRLKVDPHAQAAQALDAAERERAFLTFGRRVARDARELLERQAARDRITAR